MRNWGGRTREDLRGGERGELTASIYGSRRGRIVANRPGIRVSGRV